MKRSTFLKAIMSVALILGTMSTFAQLSEFNKAGTATSGSLSVATTATQYVTINKAVPYVALPDDVFSPNWIGWDDVLTSLDETSFIRQAGINTTNSTWTWTKTSGPGNLNITGEEQPVGTVVSNYVNISYDAAGTYEVKSAEGYLTCVDPTGTSFTTIVVDAPTIDIPVTANATTCDPAADFNIAFAITEWDVADANIGIGNGGAFEFAIKVTCQLVDGAGNPTGPATTPAYTTKYLEATDLNGGVINDYAPTLTIGAANAAPLTDADLIVRDGEPTEYTFSIVALNEAGATGNTGISSAISRKSGWIDTIDEYALNSATKSSVTYTVFPNPTTGPIFTVPNM